MVKHRICDSAALAEGGRVVVDIGERTFGIFRVHGRIYGYENTCPHQGGPVCQGTILPRVVEKLNEESQPRGFDFDAAEMRIICPWHGYEFNIETGCHPGSAGIRLSAVAVEEDAEGIHARL